MSRTTALSIALLVSAPLAAAQEERPFSTGPVTGPVTGPEAPLTPPSDDFPSPLQGGDIKANPVTTGAQNETSLAVNPLNPLNWVGVANDYSSGNVETGWYTTLDGGQTWATDTFGIDPGWSFSGDPAVAFDNQGLVHVICMMYDGPGGVDRVRHFRSANGGTAWNLGSIVGAVAGYDKPQVEADLSTSAHADDLLVAWNHFGAGFGVDNTVVSVSTDSGSSWSVPKVINGTSLTGIAPDVAWGASGEAYVMWADRGVNDVVIDRSFDGGVTWGADIKVADFDHVPDVLPGSSFRVFDIFAVHADQSGGPFSGRVYVAYHTWAAGAGNHRADVLVTTSTDQGATWSAGVKVTSDVGQQNDQLFPGLVVDRQGSVNVSYYDQRNDPGDDLLWTWISRSFDGGATWKDLQISDVGWNDNSTEFAGTFIGDYIDNEASSTGTLHPFWCDGRSGTQDVYTDKVNPQLFTDVHSVSAATGGVVGFVVNLGPNVGGHNYIMVASGSGTTPGVALPGGVVVPINHDFWTDLSLTFAGTAIFPGSIGILNAGGSATAQMNTLGPFPAIFAGTDLDFSVVSISAGQATHASPPTRVALVP